MLIANWWHDPDDGAQVALQITHLFAQLPHVNLPMGIIDGLEWTKVKGISMELN